MSAYPGDEYIVVKIKTAIKKLNDTHPSSITNGGLENRLRFNIKHDPIKQVEYKIDESLPENVIHDIKKAIIETAKQMGIAVTSTLF
jgi:ribosomal protein L11